MDSLERNFAGNGRYSLTALGKTAFPWNLLREVFPSAVCLSKDCLLGCEPEVHNSLVAALLVSAEVEPGAHQHHCPLLQRFRGLDLDQLTGELQAHLMALGGDQEMQAGVIKALQDLLQVKHGKESSILTILSHCFNLIDRENQRSCR